MAEGIEGQVVNNTKKGVVGVPVNQVAVIQGVTIVTIVIQGVTTIATVIRGTAIKITSSTAIKTTSS